MAITLGFAHQHGISDEEAIAVLRRAAVFQEEGINVNPKSLIGVEANSAAEAAVVALATSEDSVRKMFEALKQIRENFALGFSFNRHEDGTIALVN